MPRVRGLLAVTLLVLACAACGGSVRDPAAGTSETTTASIPASPSPTVSSDLATYSPDERAAFTVAIAALHRFVTTSDHFLGQGKLTKRQAAFYRRNSINWVDDWANLSQFVHKQVTYKGTPKEVWLRPVSIELNSKDGQVVEVKRCLDQSNLRVFAAGRRVPQPQLKVPHVYRISIIKKPSETWWRTGLPKQGTTC